MPDGGVVFTTVSQGLYDHKPLICPKVKSVSDYEIIYQDSAMGQGRTLLALLWYLSGRHRSGRRCTERKTKTLTLRGKLYLGEALRRAVKALLFNVICFRNTGRYYRLRGHIAHFLVSAKLYEKDQISLIKSLDLRDAIVLDVGAGFGVYSKLLSECVGEGGKVFSFEANPVIYQEMLRLVQVENIEPYNLALSDTNKKTTLYVPSILGSIPEPSLATLNEIDGCELYEVEAKALDLIDFPLEDVKFIKVDIEGHDFQFLLGAKETLRKNSTIVQFEEHDVSKLFDDYSILADELGYRVCTLVDGELKDIQQANMEDLRKKHSKGDKIFYLVPRKYKE